MRTEGFFKDPNLPIAELRYSRASNVAFKPHMHHTLSIGAVEEGEVIYTVGGKELLYAPPRCRLVLSRAAVRVGD